jgi:hypothetical protein
MDKQRIIAEIQRTAIANGGAVLGWRRFEEETGIRYYDWFGKFWTRWSDAVLEAGYEPNLMYEAYFDEHLLGKLALLTRNLGRVPVRGDYLLAARADSSFPSEKAFRKLGHKRKCAQRVFAYCESKPGNDDVAALWKPIAAAEQQGDDETTNGQTPAVGYVYLLKHGSRRQYKIGFTYNILRREGEIRIELPEAVQPVHYIETDDPAGVENYWHRRFANKQLQGEWFALSTDDVRAFKRWKRIY